MKRLFAICALFAALCGGCGTYRGGKIVEGTDIAAGLTVPQSGGTLQIDALNFLTGFRFLFAEDAGVKCSYTTTNSVKAFGVYESATVKHIEIELSPTIDEAAADEATVEVQKTGGTTATVECKDGQCSLCTDGSCSP